MENATDLLAGLYDRHGRDVWSYARALAGRTGQAEDLAADAFLALARRLRERGMPEDPLGYLLAAVRSRAVDEARRRKSAARWEAPPPAPPPRPERSVSDAERRECVVGAVRDLEPALGEAVALHVFAGLTFEDAARIAGVPRATLESRYSLALERLSFLLKDERP